MKKPISSGKTAIFGLFLGFFSAKMTALVFWKRFSNVKYRGTFKLISVNKHGERIGRYGKMQT